ncbi:Phosphoribosyl isomerase A [Fundidesulfovibrio magnetotacticus]|uniref:1-(5-phosphoribosyl)-5-[(5-phosphoribosylamino)methylideneamino] imidazole-4-carboxamide isomerase n=1 Tax=Fundidesulfovibrio magnetotacticus TaxID=2730080 RepID=A0A6V8LW25_9BACT|nr:1-(5-phosphoribosyl)-5-[(5-phosphoribosylamino)methylideneamino]imidazole-4-carboxamide isomerase [Fundidesulfovibrio magnetotacticus]GFK94259.1 Phosphoribosyl isomerase A [Fundidesulfovibrio magnetotacticus]
MILYPAIDIKDGQCVRLKQGLADQVTVFDKDPVTAAAHWLGMGAKALHVVDLDGAFEGEPRNKALVGEICKLAGDIPVQLGGGVRDLATAQAYADAGVSRLLIGTMALADPDRFGQLCKALPGRIGVSLDADAGRLKTKGWVEDSGQTVDDVLPRLHAQGAAFLVYTDISRDGMQSGVNLGAMESLLAKTKLPVIAAGGVATLDDLKALAPLAAKGLDGVISGRALYTGTLDFAEAMLWLEGQA